MTDLFVPDKVKDEDLEDLLKPKVAVVTPKEGCYLACGNEQGVTIVEDLTEEAYYEPLIVFGRGSDVKALCIHNGTLYDGTYNGIIRETFSGMKVAEREESVHTLCSFNDRLYDSGEYAEICDTFADHLIAERPDWVWSLCVHKGRLYDCGDYRAVCDTFKGEDIYECDDNLYQLVSWKNDLFVCGMDDYIVNALSERKYTLHTSAEYAVGMFAFEGDMYYYDSGRMVSKMYSNDFWVCDLDDNLNIMLEIPKTMLEGYL